MSILSKEKYKDKTVAIIASGPSLTKDDCDLIKSYKWPTIVINDSYRIAPFADVLYACDGSWWDVHYPRVKEDYSGELWTQDKNIANKYNINYVKSANKAGLGVDNIIHQGANSGYQCINLAYLWGAKRIVVIGLDCSADPSGKTHWFGLHQVGLSNSHPFSRWISSFNVLATDLKKHNIEVINASRRTSLTCFDRRALEDCF
jgi:hypothetical protein